LRQASTIRLVNCYNSFYGRKAKKKIAFEMPEQVIEESSFALYIADLMKYKSSRFTMKTAYFSVSTHIL